MDGRFSDQATNNNLEDSENTTSDNSGEFQLSRLKMSSNHNTPQKRSRRAVQKRVVTVPIGDVNGSRIKPDGAPPYDSWAWRKYGQKPIKGSPYPRGYYRCSSSKGCPARKQVERSRVDPTMLVITYACDHNHSGPPSRNHNSSSTTTTPTISPKSEPEESVVFADNSNKFTDLGDECNSLEYTWFTDVGSTSETVLIESPVYSGMSSSREADVAVRFPMREEDELLFADLGELPECSVVFERGFCRRQCSLGAG